MNISPQDSISDRTIPDDYELDDILTSNHADSPLHPLDDADEYWPCEDNMDTANGVVLSIPLESVLSPSSVCGYDSLQGRSPSLLDLEDTYGGYESSRKGGGRGLVGLINFGNTCFMNSALQCLFHTTPFVEYFLQDYKGDINFDNPLGTHGELALSFGELLRKAWSSEEERINPFNFKENIAKFAPQFGGYNQHDSQELLAFLLDGLHEDLNRVKKRPYIEKTDAEGPDEELAHEFWKNHKARNDSIIVDIFQGQYKSRLVCPYCGKISITFDPFMYLSLPVPSVSSREMTITVIYGDGSAPPLPHTLTVMDNWFIKDIVSHLALSCTLKDEEDDLFLVEVSHHRIVRYFSDPMERVHSIRDGDCIVAYHVPLVREGLVKVELLHRRMERCGVGGMEYWETRFFATPIMVFVTHSSMRRAGRICLPW